MKNKEKKKNKILKITILIVSILLLLLLLSMVILKWRISGTTFYRITEGECNSAMVYEEETSGLNEKGECINSGYYIDNNRVNVNIGSINCANGIEIVKLKVDKKMNVEIKVKEKKSREQAKCICKPSINIIFTKKVNSVTVTTEDGIKLRKCN